jgi:UDP-arabinose 4-epimerase
MALSNNNQIMRENILVTGGAGYIGSHVCKALYAAGYNPVTYDNLSSGHDWAVKWGPLERGDILEASRLKEVFASYKPAAVMHFAALIAVGDSVDSPAKYYRNNVAGSLTLLEVMSEQDVCHFIFSSTAAVYGLSEIVPIAETAKERPINPYGETKLIVERMLRDFSAAYALNWTALRYFNAAGADPDGEIGEAHDPETHLIPITFEAIQGKRDRVDVFGTDYDTRDGTCVRDYIHVCDLADAHVAALERLRRGGSSEAYNLGNGAGFTVSEVIAAAESVTGRTAPVHYGARRPGDPASLIADARRAKEELNWCPRLGSLDDIIGTAWRWHNRSNA